MSLSGIERLALVATCVSIATLAQTTALGKFVGKELRKDRKWRATCRGNRGQSTEGVYLRAIAMVRLEGFAERQSSLRRPEYRARGHRAG